MADRGTSNSPNTRNPDRPPSHPSRLDQFADDLFDSKLSPDGVEVAEELSVTSNKERQTLRKTDPKEKS